MDSKLKRLADLGVVRAGIGLYQNEFHKFDVYQHTLQCVENLVGMGAHPDLLAAGYLHDIGKPRLAVPLIQNGQVVTDAEGHPLHDFKPGHEELGREMVLLLPEEIFEELGLNQKVVAEIVGCHYLPMTQFKKLKHLSSKEGLRRFYEDFHQILDQAPARREDIVDICVADALAKGTSDPHRPVLKALRDFLVDKKDNFEELYQFWKVYEKHVKTNRVLEMKQTVILPESLADNEEEG
ncbi:MAG: HD domain-containing protein [Candidatus Tectomicrobia bacterium]|uniref:HD domain-containing protein n=1 Tax=Tectimicrobiota bacterium TaxID=2528274 RepID=A0A932FWH8_UNCTE|nr:HD domain-containing protein [Candidatus Tectomicrobia bacterium]